MRAARKPPVSVLSRFWLYVNQEGPVHPKLGTPCWVWTGATNNFGYGQIHNGIKNVYAHRLSWEIHNGTLAAGLCVLHRCDNPPCVNPAHHFIGTKKQNSEDMVAKGRAARQGTRATHCHRGHELTPENTIINSKRHPNKYCRTCRNAWQRAYRLQKKAS